MYSTILPHFAQARVAEFHRQAQRHALARAAGQAHRARRQPSGHRTPGVLAAVTGWARRQAATPGSP
jgi:hypothetical protein